MRATAAKENGGLIGSIARITVDERADPAGATIEQLEELYRARRPQFLRVAAAITGDRERAHDAVQEAFGRAIRRRSTYAGRGTLEAWVWAFVVHAARDERAARTELPLGDVVESNGHADEDGGLSLAVSLLPERQRLVLFLRYYADLDYASIATALGIADGTVAATLHAAHAALRRMLKEVRS
jgi:RNA polymerase sigma-70 factor (ECF subfamily)